MRRLLAVLLWPLKWYFRSMVTPLSQEDRDEDIGGTAKPFWTKKTRGDDPPQE